MQIQVESHRSRTLLHKSGLNIHNSCVRNNLSVHIEWMFSYFYSLTFSCQFSLWLVFAPSAVFFALVPPLRFQASCYIPTTMRRKHFSSKSQPYFLFSLCLFNCLGFGLKQIWRAPRKIRNQIQWDFFKKY